MNLLLWCKAEILASLLQSSVSLEPSEIILIFQFAAQETVFIIIYHCWKLNHCWNATKMVAFVTRNINLRVKFLLRSPLAALTFIFTCYLHVMPFFLIVLRSNLLLCSRIKPRRFCIKPRRFWTETESFSGKKSFKQCSSSLQHSSADAHLLNTAQLCSAREIEMTETCK